MSQVDGSLPTAPIHPSSAGNKPTISFDIPLPHLPSNPKPAHPTHKELSTLTRAATILGNTFGTISSILEHAVPFAKIESDPFTLLEIDEFGWTIKGSILIAKASSDAALHGLIKLLKTELVAPKQA